MLLTELKRKIGTYVGVKLNQKSKDALEALLKEKDIPLPVPQSKMHITVIYSKKPTSFTSKDCKGNLDPPLKLVPDAFHIFETQEGWKALVLKVKSPELTARHNEIMEKFGASYDFDTYHPHVTLSYNIGDYDMKKMGKVGDMAPLFADVEYEEPLNLDFLGSKNKKQRKDDKDSD